MSAPRRFRVHATMDRANAPRADGPLPERLLRGIGAERAFTDDVLGDLTEECARRSEHEGALAARWWYLREIVRAVPHLAWNAVQHGGTEGRLRVAAFIAILASVPAVVSLSLLLRVDAPARLVVDGPADEYNSVVINTRHLTLLSVQAFDGHNRLVPSVGTRYERVTGDALALSPDGQVKCDHSSDTMVRASLHGAQTTMTIRCRPVKLVRAIRWMYFVPGQAPEPLEWEARAPDGGEERLLMGRLMLTDTSIARLRGDSIRPLRAGHTSAVMQIGDATGITQVSVFEPVRSFVGLHADQKFVIAPLRLARGESAEWPLPTALFWLRYHRDHDTDPIPLVTATGPVQCLPVRGRFPDQWNCLVSGAGATVRLVHPGGVAGPIVGRFSLEVHPPTPF